MAKQTAMNSESQIVVYTIVYTSQRLQVTTHTKNRGRINEKGLITYEDKEFKWLDEQCNTILAKQREMEGEK